MLINVKKSSNFVFQDIKVALCLLLLKYQSEICLLTQILDFVMNSNRGYWNI